LATHLIEKYSAQNFTSFVSERIFKPVGMHSSTYLPSQAAATGKFSQSWSPVGPRRIPNWFDDNVRCLGSIAHFASLMVFTQDYAIASGPGGVISTIADMTKWVRLVMGRTNDTTAMAAIPRSVLDPCLTPHIPIPITPQTPASIPGATNITYGFGWWQMNFGGHEVWAELFSRCS
jgi:CubicO group peptidase (beta-lactamase class C family)